MKTIIAAALAILLAFTSAVRLQQVPATHSLAEKKKTYYCEETSVEPDYNFYVPDKAIIREATFGRNDVTKLLRDLYVNRK